MIGFYYEQLQKAREVAVALSQNLISFHKRRRASARTPMIIGKFENMVRNNMLFIIDVKTAIVCKPCF
jgi:hypothetical protein